MSFADFAKQDSDFLKASGRLYRVFFASLLIAYFLPTSLLAFTSYGLKLISSWLASSPKSFFHNQVLLLNELGPQFGLTYLFQVAIYFTFPLCFAVFLARISRKLVRRAREAGQVFPELPKLFLFSLLLSVASFAPLLFSGYIAASSDRSIGDRIILWPASVSITFGSSLFMMIGLHSLFIAARLRAP